MRLFVVVASLVALPLLADESQTARGPLASAWDDESRIYDRVGRVNELRPRRRDTPLRELNISDNEVREIQDVAARHGMTTMLNISPVVTGCPCEEGLLCTDQVYVVADLPDKTVGLQLSRVRNAWVVGTVQMWWFRYDALLKKQTTMDWWEFIKARNELLREFPMCALQDNGATTARSRETPR